MRTLEEATTLYFDIRSGLSKRVKSSMGQFEAQKFFRFGNSWRRLSHNKSNEVILYDDKDELVFSKAAGRSILGTKCHL